MEVATTHCVVDCCCVDASLLCLLLCVYVCVFLAWHLTCHQVLRFSNENSYLNWARNGVLSSAVGVAMYAQEHHRGAQLSGAGGCAPHIDKTCLDGGHKFVLLTVANCNMAWCLESVLVQDCFCWASDTLAWARPSTYITSSASATSWSCHGQASLERFPMRRGG